MTPHNLAIESIYTITPKLNVTSEDLIKGHDEIDYYRDSYKKFGIFSRYNAGPKDIFEELAADAINSLLADQDIETNKIKYLVVISQTSSGRLPNSGHLIQQLTGLNKDCVIYDINDGCNGYINGLSLMSKILSEGEKGLLVCGDLMSKYTTKNELSNKLLMGDAISVTLLKETNKKNGLIKIFNDGSGANSIRIEKSSGKELFKMDGFKVFSFTMSKIPKLIKSFLEENNEIVETYDFFVLHQANKILLDNIKKKLSIHDKKMLTSLDKYGNTGPASIPVTLSSNKINAKSKVLFVGFGAGLSWGVFSMNNLNFHSRVLHK